MASFVSFEALRQLMHCARTTAEVYQKGFLERFGKGDRGNPKLCQKGGAGKAHFDDMSKSRDNLRIELDGSPAI